VDPAPFGPVAVWPAGGLSRPGADDAVRALESPTGRFLKYGPSSHSATCRRVQRILECASTSVAAPGSDLAPSARCAAADQLGARQTPLAPNSMAEGSR